MVAALLHIHHHIQGPKIGLVGIAVAALVSWAGVPGAGEAALVTGAIFAARGKLDIASVVVSGLAGATIGGIAGWLVGMRAGRALLEAPGPAYRLRLRALHRGERFFERYGVLAVFVLPSWVAGIERMRPSRFLPANFVSAVLWACGYGIGAYFIGPSVYDLAGDIGTFGSIAIGLVIIAALLAGYVRRRRRRGDRRRPGRTA